MRFALFLLLIPYTLLGQTVFPDFHISSSACLNETLKSENTSIGASSFEWDFCQGDLSLTPIGTNRGQVNGTSIPLGIDVVFDGANWYGFLTSRNSNSIFRFRFDPQLNTISQITNLGNINSLLNQPVAIKIIADNNNWYGFVSNQSGALANSLITRIDFGVSLDNNSPTAVSILSDITFATDAGLDLVQHNSTWYVIYTQIGLGPLYKVGIIKLETVETVPDPDDFLSISFVGSPSLHDVKVIKDEQDKFHAYVVADSPSQLFHLNFGSNLFSSPTLSNRSSVLPAGISPYGLDGAFDNGSYKLFIANDGGALVQVNLGSNLDLPPMGSQNLGTLGVFGGTRKLKLIKERSNWHIFSVNYFGGDVFRASFPTPNCESSVQFSTLFNPEVSYQISGSKGISLRAYNGKLVQEKHRTVSIISKEAPQIDFSFDAICKQTVTQFFLSANQAILTAEWKFGDSNTSALINPVNIYESAGQFLVEASVTSSNNCANFKSKVIKIYDPPSSNFVSPSGLICTNNQFTFANSTIDNFDGNLNYQWYVDNIPSATTRDLNYSFQTTGNADVKLITSIPGCSSEQTQTVTNVLAGPIVDFTINGKCQNETISFNSNSSGDIQSYAWDFGNGQSSSVLSPSIAFSNAGNYLIQLAATATNGCVSTKRIQHKVFQIPQTDFTIELPPFSCSGSPTQFTDLTPSLVDSNLSGWLWNFNDGGVTASSQNPQHTYMQSGQYNVSLLLTSDQGCSNQLTKAVTIASSPSPSIQNSPSCINTGVEIWDGSAVTAADWQWRIGNSFYFNERPIHVFANPGSYQISLIATATNGCVATVFKNVMVPAAIDVDFTFSKNCVNSETLLTAVSQAAADPIHEYLWTLEGEQRFGQGTAFEFLSSGQKEASLAVKTEAGCDYSLTKFINIFPGPVANFSASQLSGPPPLNVQFTNLSTAATSFEWKFNDGANASSTLNAPSFSFTEIGDYPVDLRARNEVGCEDVATQLVRVAFPSPAVSLLDFSAEETIEGLIQLSTRVSNSGNVDYENLIFEITLSNNTRFQEIVQTPLLRGQTKDIELTTRIASTSSMEFICIQLLLPENAPEAVVNKCIPIRETTNFRVPYPNPTNDNLFVDWIASEGQIVSLTLINLQGLEKVSMDLISDQGLNSFILPVQSLAPGLYFLRMKTGAKAQVFRFLIQ